MGSLGRVLGGGVGSLAGDLRGGVGVSSLRGNLGGGVGSLGECPGRRCGLPWQGRWSFLVEFWEVV